MKATKSTSPSFTPIIVTLESQAEVDAIFAFLNHVTLSGAAGIPTECESWEALEPYRNHANCLRIHESLNEAAKL